MEITSRSILILSFFAIVASVSVAFYSSVLAQDFEIYYSEDEYIEVDNESKTGDVVGINDEL